MSPALGAAFLAGLDCPEIPPEEPTTVPVQLVHRTARQCLVR